MGTSDGTIDDECDVLVSATGFLSKWRWPGIEGIKDFKGDLMHSASWDPTFDGAGKRISVIGTYTDGYEAPMCRRHSLTFILIIL